MFQTLFQALTRWLGAEAEKATERAITEGVQRGARNALLKLTGGAVDPADVLGLTITAEPPERIEAGDPAPLTAADLRGLRKDDLVTLAKERGIEIPDGATVAELREWLTAE